MIKTESRLPLALINRMIQSMSRGGPRPGSGRPPSGERKASLVVRLRMKVANDLRATIPSRTRSAWIEALIVEALRRTQRSL